MGNNSSRVAPARTLHVLDSQTRARYQNQRELVQLRVKLRNIQIKHSDALSRLAYDRHEVRMQLHELQHANRQRQLFGKLERRNRQGSTSSVIESDDSNASDVSASETGSLLLHNTNASIEWERSIIFPNKPKTINTYKTVRSKYSSKSDTSHHSFKPSESLALNDNLSLKQHAEQMTKSIKIAVARAARDSNVVARHDTRIY